MLSVSEAAELNVPADVVWKTLGDFGAADRYLDVVERCELRHHGSSVERLLHLRGGGLVHERLVQDCPHDRALRYTIVDSPLPVADYVSTLRVDALDGERCRVSWSATFDPDGAAEEQARDAVAAIYRMGFDGLRRLHAT
ncbi:hypothetical protein ATSB10_05360 [Dyella thiooxydans]|uniref:Polyketide cyclase n=1 Tax=Dyella thiooxydans TaxID=445710 RepID=A0A160MXS8_9GAMM|nr:SRPBCC family protein [Dyella thiooxydans]AND67990.1 hypothetical protein ATSB10_05360 [Dyella thiooxydans]